MLGHNPKKTLPAGIEYLKPEIQFYIVQPLGGIIWGSMAGQGRRQGIHVHQANHPSTKVHAL